MTALTYAIQILGALTAATWLAVNLPAIVLAVIDSERGRR